MPEVGLEPTWDCSRQILSLVRIPISPLRREVLDIKTLHPGGQDGREMRASADWNAGVPPAGEPFVTHQPPDSQRLKLSEDYRGYG